eukprot:COSAG01_NODE_33351_length_565_cov_1.723176_1_plen_111_part_00
MKKKRTNFSLLMQQYIRHKYITKGQHVRAKMATEQYANIMNQLIADVSRAEAERDVARARIEELESELRLARITLPKLVNKPWENNGTHYVIIQMPNGRYYGLDYQEFSL